MSIEDELTIQEESQRLMDIIAGIEEKLRLHTEIKFSETETIALNRAKLRLSELEKADAKELQRIINDSIEKGEGLFPKEAFREIPKD